MLSDKSPLITNSFGNHNNFDNLLSSIGQGYPATSLLPKNHDHLKLPRLSRLSLDHYGHQHTEDEFQRLTENEADLVEAAASIEEERMQYRLVDVLALMAIYDGELGEEERKFLKKMFGRLDVPLDIQEVERRTPDYRAAAREYDSEGDLQCQGCGHGRWRYDPRHPGQGVRS